MDVISSGRSPAEQEEEAQAAIHEVATEALAEAVAQKQLLATGVPQRRTTGIHEA